MKLNEVHWTDLYPESFQQFRKKYLPLLRARKISDLWIQFSNFADNTMDRNPSPVQDHHDPSGVYAYPISYVLTYPADVWYGQGAKFMRVLRNVSKKSFGIRYIDSENKCARMLNNAGFTVPEINEMMWLARKHYKDRVSGTNKWGKVFLQCMQVDLINPPVGETKPGMFSKGGPEYRIRTGKEQSALFLKMGIDAIIDDAKTNKAAIINDREPEQICFLTRAAFRVEEVYDLRGGMAKEKLPTFTHPDPSGTHIERALASTLAKMMDDQISESSNDQKTRSKLDMAYHYYWTKKGRRINISFDRPNSYYDNKKMGEKKHRADKLSSSFNTKITIETELGKIQRSFYHDETFKDIIDSIARAWIDLKENPQPTGWEPQNSDSFMAKVNADKDEYYRKEDEKRKTEALKDLPQFLEDAEFVAKYYGLPFEPNENYEDNIDVMGMMQYYSNHSRQKGEREDVPTQVEHWIETCKHWTDAINKQSTMKQIHELANVLLKAAPTHEWSVKLGPRMFSHIARDISEKMATQNENL